MLLGVPTAGCEIVHGNGVPARVERRVEDFSRVVVVGSRHVEARIGSPPSVEVSGDQNIVCRVKTVVEGGSLRVEDEHGVMLDPELPLVVRVTAPQLAGLSVTGSGTIDAREIRGQTLDTSLSGSGKIHLGGEVESLSVDVSGSGTIDAAALRTRSTRVSLSGSGNIDVCSSDRVNVRVSGSGTVAYSCNPTTVEQAVDGSGKIVQR